MRQSQLLAVGLIAISLSVIFLAYETLSLRCEIAAAQYLPKSDIALDPQWDGACMSAEAGILNRQIYSSGCTEGFSAAECATWRNHSLRTCAMASFHPHQKCPQNK
jgi:hypothetical protein